jgi:hypothetical protein
VRVEKSDAPLSGQKAIGIKSSYAHSLFRQWALAEGFRESTIPAVNGFVQRLQANKAVPGIVVRHTKSGNWLTGLKILATDCDPESDGIQEVKPLDLDASGWNQG